MKPFGNQFQHRNLKRCQGCSALLGLAARVSQPLSLRRYGVSCAFCKAAANSQIWNLSNFFKPHLCRAFSSNGLLVCYCFLSSLPDLKKTKLNFVYVDKSKGKRGEMEVIDQVKLHKCVKAWRRNFFSFLQNPRVCGTANIFQGKPTIQKSIQLPLT